MCNKLELFIVTIFYMDFSVTYTYDMSSVSTWIGAMEGWGMNHRQASVFFWPLHSGGRCSMNVALSSRRLYLNTPRDDEPCNSDFLWWSK